MVTFPSFKCPKTYQLYKKQLSEDWHKRILPIFFVILLFEIMKIIEDASCEEIALKGQLEYKLARWTAYVLITLCRYLFIIRVQQYKETFLDRTDFLSFLVLIAGCLVTYQASFYSQSVHPLWVTKLILRNLAIFICLGLSFYNWYYFPLTITLFLGMGAFWNVTTFSDHLWYWVPTYISIFIGAWGLIFSLERIRRTHFEQNILGLGDSDASKKVINNLPYGILAINKDKEVLYSNAALYSMLNVSFPLNFKCLNEFNTAVEIKMTNYDTRSQCEPEAPELHLRNSFVNLQQDIWKKWDTLVSYFQTAPQTDYLHFRGTLAKPARNNKPLDIRLCMREIDSQHVIILTFLDIPDIILVNMLSQALNQRSQFSDEDRNSYGDEVSIKDGYPILGQLNEGKDSPQSPLVPFETERKLIEIPTFRSKNTSNRRKKSITDQSSRLCECPQILIADDDAFVILSFENILHTLNYTVASCYNGQQVLEVVQRRIESPCCGFCKPFRAIFLDSHMPIMDGYECALKLNELFKKWPDCRCPIIALEPFNPFETNKKKRQNKVDAVCRKPVSKPDVESILKFYSRYDVKQNLNTTCF